ncbi:hypothetical protein FACS1894217_11910 [Clostridia bacterium]|nr:hypothetical protein FACS1894217_11910 [Clostridia bacterium]
MQESVSRNENIRQRDESIAAHNELVKEFAQRVVAVGESMGFTLEVFSEGLALAKGAVQSRTKVASAIEWL